MDWLGLRVLAHKPGECPVMYGPYQNCNATILSNLHTFLSYEICSNGKDDNGNGLVDHEDPGCMRCGGEWLP